MTVSLAACGGGSDATANAPTPSADEKEKPAATGKMSLADPRSLTGLSTVGELPDPTPIAGSHPQKLPVTLQDEEGTSVTVADTSRVIPLDLYGTISRTVISLGLGDKIVGRTSSSTESALAKVPVVTENGHALNAEAILSLKPTLIIADRSVGPVEAIAQIRSAGIPVVIVSQDRSLETNGALIRSVARAVGMDSAGEALAKRTDDEVAAAEEKIKQWAPKEPLRAAFLYVRGRGGVFFILGKEYGVSALIKGIGARDVAAEQGIESMAPANAESLVSLNPEVYLMMSHGIESAGGIDTLLKRPGMANTDAGRKPRIVAIPDGIALAFGPQTGQIMEVIARQLYGVPADEGSGTSAKSNTEKR